MSGHGKKKPDGVARIVAGGTVIGIGLDERGLKELMENDHEVMGFIAHVSEMGEAGIYRLPDGNAIQFSPKGEAVARELRSPPFAGEGGLTDDETAVMKKLVGAWNEFCLLSGSISPQEQQKFADGIHLCQDVLAYRVLHRAHPDFWRKP